MNYVVWQEAELLIRASQRADIFLILDCCHAGSLIGTRQKSPWSERIFDFLGAYESGQTTPLPGPTSFTSALIHALETLASDGERFTSSELQKQDPGCARPPRKRTGALPERTRASLCSETSAGASSIEEQKA